MKTTITRSETIPHIDKDGVVMQMRHYEIGITVEGDDPIEVQAEVDRLFESERSKVFLLVPTLKTKEKRIQYVLGALKAIAPDRYDKIANEAKAL